MGEFRYDCAFIFPQIKTFSLLNKLYPHFACPEEDISI